MRVVSKTHVGLVRENNEDALLVREPYLFAVADGMGGYAAGEIASRSTIKAFAAATHCLRHEQEENVGKVMLEAFNKANTHVHKMSLNNSNYNGMGTTMTALYLPGNSIGYCCHIGDSRMYRFREGKLEQMTQDHTYVASLLAEGKISEEEAMVHPKRHMLLQAVGVEDEIQADLLQIDVKESDRILLCSDGLTDMLKDEEIAELIALENLEEAGEQLLEKALDNGGRDNVSLILIEIGQSGEESLNG